jgi:initiation factor 1A
MKMPNAKGGKGYKKGKHDGAEAQLLECNEGQNQMYGRTMKSLGNRRFRIFCNDNKERVCKVCGSMRKSQWVEPGSIVLISIRDLSMSTVHGSSLDVDIGDIIGLIDHSLIGKMKKVPGVNPLLFTNIEARDKTSLSKSIKAQEDGVEEDDFFTRGSEDEDEDDEAEKAERKEKKKAKELEIASARDTKYNEDADVNIDDI